MIERRPQPRGQFRHVIMNDLEPNSGRPPDRWLLLIHQIPAKPAYLRVKIWRRLQSSRGSGGQERGLCTPRE